MSDFMHCNTCYVQPSAQGIPAYFLTTCYHILCKGCLQKETGDPRLCPVCKHEMNAVEINSAMDPKLQNLFKPPKKLVEEKLTVLKRKYDFQQTLVNSLLGHLKQQRAKLEQMTKYCQEQAKYSKDKAKEMAELKQWVSTAETKMKSSEQEKACLLKEIEELRKLTKRFGREPSCESTIDKIFGGTEIDNIITRIMTVAGPQHDAGVEGDSAKREARCGARTRDSQIKSLVLYRLS
ncbi:hypothetical protein Q1695_009768 [Nippostrongylus brasiliensis]|nr:hypothetical protein Q1695_009768 [Nippostrongylus brasiliensis]